MFDPLQPQSPTRNEAPAEGTRNKPETNRYRVIHCPEVAVRDSPWGHKTGTRTCGEIVKTDIRSVGGKNGGWVRLEGGAGWMLLHGGQVGAGLGVLMRLVDSEPVMVMRYRVTAQPDVPVRSLPHGGHEVGKRARGRVVRGDLQLAGWVRLQADFKGHGGVLSEGWVPVQGAARYQSQQHVQPWAPAAEWAEPADREETSRYWVVCAVCVVRERPWGRIVSRKARGVLVRCDGKRDGWVRLEEDFLDGDQGSGVASFGFRVDTDDDELEEVLEGWILIDGSDVGLHKQLVPYAGEEAAPQIESAGNSESARAAARRDAMAARREAEKTAGEDWSVDALLHEAGLPGDLAEGLAAKGGVHRLHDLIRTVSKGDYHEELKACGVGKLGQRQKLATIVQPYWHALALKDQGNASYKKQEFEAAIDAYTVALEAMPCKSVDIALRCYNNRAACYQQMREPEKALADVRCVLKYDATDAKALARQQVNQRAVEGES